MEWTEEQIRAQGYETDGDHPANRGKPDRHVQQIEANAAHRESMLPCARSAGQPLAPKEEATPRMPNDWLFRDKEWVERAQAYVTGRVP